jgi:hypothetical protein
MDRLLHLLAVCAALFGLLPPARALGQTPYRAETPPARSLSSQESDELLPGLPRPPDEPRSLLKQPSATLPYNCDQIPGPYFERDARLDPPELPQPGWFGDAEIGIVSPHVKNRLADMVTVGGVTNNVHLPGAELSWTVSPRFELGYNLPTGFGGFAVSYRLLITDGNETTGGPDGPMAVKSHLENHIASLDYVSRELSLWESGPQKWEMRWRLGLRFASVFFDSDTRESFAAAAAGSGVVGSRTSNNFQGLGPHAGVWLERKLSCPGLAFVAALDGASIVGRTRQSFFEETTTVGPGAVPIAGADRFNNPQTVPVLNLQVGLDWQAPALSCAHLFLGYEYEYWWDVGRVSTTFHSRGEMSNQGVLLRAEFNY